MPITTQCSVHGRLTNDCIAIAFRPAVQDGGCEHGDVGWAVQQLRERRGVRPQPQVVPVRLRRRLPDRTLPVAGADGVPLGEAAAREAAVLQRKVTRRNLCPLKAHLGMNFPGIGSKPQVTLVHHWRVPSPVFCTDRKQ